MYDWIKALHVVFVLLFAGGLVALLVASMALGKRDPAAEDQSSKLRATVRKWDMWVSQPALGGVWVFGLWAAFSGGWFTEPWLQIKLVFVLILSALHGNLAKQTETAGSDCDTSQKRCAVAVGDCDHPHFLCRHRCNGRGEALLRAAIGAGAVDFPTIPS